MVRQVHNCRCKADNRAFRRPLPFNGPCQWEEEPAQLPQHLKAQVNREIDRLELLLKQIKTVEAERDALLVAVHTPGAVPASMLLNITGIGPEVGAVLW